METTTIHHRISEPAYRAAERLIRDITDSHLALRKTTGDTSHLRLRYIDARKCVLNCLRSTENDANTIFLEWWSAYLSLTDCDILVRTLGAYAYWTNTRRLKRKLARAIHQCLL